MKEIFSFSEHLVIQANRKRNIESLFEPKGKYHIEHYRDGKLLNKYDITNAITNVGKNLIFNVMFNNATAIAQSAWAIGLIDAFGYTGTSVTDTMSSHGTWAEFTSYSQSTRVAWGSGSSSSQLVTNATAAVFDITGGANTLKGIFVTGSNTKSGTSSTLWSTGLFTADVPVTTGDQIKITYSVAA